MSEVTLKNPKSREIATGTGKCLWNPYVTLNREDSGEASHTLITVPIKGQGRKVLRVASTDPLVEAIHAIVQANPEERAQELPENLVAELLAAGILCRTDAEIPRPIVYGCFLENHLAGGRENAGEVEGGSALALNPHTAFSSRGEVPEKFREQVRVWSGEKMLLPHPLVWVWDPGLCVVLPYWLRASEEDQVRSLLSGQVRLGELSPPVRSLLYAANVLIGLADQGARDARREEDVRRGQEEVRRQGYAVMRNLVHPLHVRALHDYYQSLIREGWVDFSDPQVAGRYHIYQEAVAQFYHDQLGSLVGRIVAQPIQPSYCFFASYQPGAVLEKHVDRPQCEFSISLHVGSVPHPGGKFVDWPLYVQDRAGQSVPVHLLPGDGLIYLGKELPHWREEFRAGESYDNIFFHYVPRDFSDPLW